MQKNELVTVRIEDIGVNGEGIGKVNGYTLFVKDAVIGDVVEARVTKAKKNYGYARLMKVLEPSVHRVAPLCAFARKCGGCQIQEMFYERQLEFKQAKVKGNLERIGGFGSTFLDTVCEPIIGMEDPFHYRNKAQFPFGVNKDGKAITGFYAGRTHDIIANTDCALGVPENKKILEIILSFLEEYGIRPYDEKSGEGLLRHVLIRYGFTTKEIMVCLIVNGKKIPHAEKLIQRLTEMEGMTSITLSPNTKRTNVIMGESYEVLWGQAFITDYIGKIRYQISPLSFYQVNPVQTEKLYELALEYADLKGEETVWDLYCGIGTISLFLAQKAKQVYGVEIVPQAIEDAKQNARINGITNAEFYVGKAEEILPRVYAEGKKKELRREDTRIAERIRAGVHGENQKMGDGAEEPRYSDHPGYAGVIVVDPPRKGCDEALLKTIVEMQPERVVYVSCDSATLARDLKYLCGNGYELKRWRAVDQFPMSVHTECAVSLSKRHAKQNIEVELEMSEMD